MKRACKRGLGTDSKCRNICTNYFNGRDDVMPTLSASRALIKFFCVFRGHRFSWTKRFSQPFHPGDSPGYSTVGEAPPSLRCLSLPHHALPCEADEDLTISPYASYTSLTERAPPIISGWLDKLSPQGCVCFTQLMGPGCGRRL